MFYYNPEINYQNPELKNTMSQFFLHTVMLSDSQSRKRHNIDKNQFSIPLPLKHGKIAQDLSSVGLVREQRSKSEMETPPNLAMLSTEMVDKMFTLTVPEGSTKDHPVSNPTGPLAPNLQHMKLPPFLVAIADHDLLRDTQFEYCEAMKMAGKSVEVFKCKNVGHCFHLNTIDANISRQTQDLLDVIQNFIKTCCREVSK